MTTENPYKDDTEDRKAARAMDEIVKTVFAPIYPLIAEQIKSKHGIVTGNCIDLGSGPAALSIALARITDLNLYALDQSVHSYAIATANIEEQGLAERITPVRGNVEDMPFDDNYADLIVSRGSVFFWEDLKAAFNEIYRVLKPGGKTHIGGGFGSAELKKSIFMEMAKKDGEFAQKSKGRMNPENMKRIKTALNNSHASQYDMTQSDAGFWIHITKE
ncbi:MULTISPECIES: class I SAM-dependent methyltransferase [Desulfobacula]|uniref:Predicted methyltransferase, type 11 n=2 Tax=Desulfobacula TaxID=28222 RepID=K0NGX9_DESTT|nr:MULTISPECIES: class I SAM-dependent methyltransferase [Desulfobacula]CCK79098.1 predicted methyltransferase, type 11 [Desulfobacula toluolica Tol2]SDU06992.1 Methyltransferase domain-containing protein [Desulfobacula phenolica]